MRCSAQAITFRPGWTQAHCTSYHQAARASFLHELSTERMTGDAGGERYGCGLQLPRVPVRGSTFDAMKAIHRSQSIAQGYNPDAQSTRRAQARSQLPKVVARDSNHCLCGKVRARETNMKSVEGGMTWHAWLRPAQPSRRRAAVGVSRRHDVSVARYSGRKGGSTSRRPV